MVLFLFCFVFFCFVFLFVCFFAAIPLCASSAQVALPSARVVWEQSQSGLLVEGLREMVLRGHLLHINGFCFSPESVVRGYVWLLSVSGSFVLSCLFLFFNRVFINAILVR